MKWEWPGKGSVCEECGSDGEGGFIEYESGRVCHMRKPPAKPDGRIYPIMCSGRFVKPAGALLAALKGGGAMTSKEWYAKGYLTPADVSLLIADLAEAEMRIADLEENWRTAQRQEQYLDAKVEEYVKTIEDMAQEAHEQEKRLARAEESYQHLTAALAHTIEERDAIATKLAECHEALDVAIAPVDVGGGEKVAASNLAKQLAECQRRLAEVEAERDDYKTYYEADRSDPSEHDLYAAAYARIEARRAKEVER